LIAPMMAVSMAPPAPPAITCEMMPPMLRLPDCAAAVIAGSNNVTIWPSTPPPIKPEIILPIIPRSKVGEDLPTPARIEISVVDNGPGITAEVTERLFHPLTTSKTDGLGLGLSISASIVEAHGGRIWLQTGKAGMTEFRFSLPLETG
jgi:signal transduction histidine kinase